MKNTWDFLIPEASHMDIQSLYRVDGAVRTGMATMAAELISDHYAKMKDDFPKDNHKL